MQKNKMKKLIFSIYGILLLTGIVMSNALAGTDVKLSKGECLDHLVLFGLESLRRALSCYRTFFNDLRPHQGIGNRIPRQRADGRRGASAGNKPVSCATVQRTALLGGLLNSYSRKAA